jgi:hypothetical protein
MRMLKVLLSACVLIFSLSCSQKSTVHNEEFDDHQRWLTGDDYHPRSLSGKPKEVKEISYLNLSDTTFDTYNSKSGVYDVFQFDTSGRMILRRSSFDSVSITDFTFTYTDTGRQSKIISYDVRGVRQNQYPPIRRVIMRRTGQNSFKSITYDDTVETRSEVWKFLDDGQRVEKQQWQHDVLISEGMREFRRDTLIYEMRRNVKTKKEWWHYYSTKGYLDSTVTFLDGKPSERTWYINNDMNDPIWCITENPSARTDSVYMKYEYDQRGNWIKMLMWQSEKINVILSPEQPNPKFPNWSLKIREIKY